MSSITPAGCILVQSASSRIVGIGQKNYRNCKVSKNAVVIILIEYPRLISLFPMEILYTIAVTMGLPGFVYFSILDWFVIHSDISPIT